MANWFGGKRDVVMKGLRNHCVARSYMYPLRIRTINLFGFWLFAIHTSSSMPYGRLVRSFFGFFAAILRKGRYLHGCYQGCYLQAAKIYLI